MRKRTHDYVTNATKRSAVAQCRFSVFLTKIGFCGSNLSNGVIIRLVLTKSLFKGEPILTLFWKKDA